MSRKRSGWYERQEVSKITNDWVRLNCKTITNRERELLRIVNDRKLVRRDHLEIIHPEYRNIPKRTSVINRSITKLFRKMCLDKVHEESEFMAGNKPAILSLDRAGAIILDVDFRRRIQINKRRIGTEELIFRELPSNYYHIHGVNQLEVDTIEVCENRGFKLIRWDLEEKNVKIVQFNEKIMLKPDVFVIINAQNKPFLAFIEYDTGSENNRYKDQFPILREKLEKYQIYKLSNIWQNEFWAKKINTGFPPVLFVTEDDKRINYVRDKGRELDIIVIPMLAIEYKNKLDGILG